MDVVRAGLGSGAPGGEVTVAQRAQRLAGALLGWVESVVDELPGVHQAPAEEPPAALSAPACPPRSTPMTSLKAPRRAPRTPASASSAIAVSFGRIAASF